jgi:uncharacterized protein YkwD
VKTSSPGSRPIAGRGGRSARLIFALFLVLLCVPAPAAAQLPAPGGSSTTIHATTVNGVVLGKKAAAMLNLINDARAAHGLALVRPRTVLCKAAQSHSREMIVYGYFSHNSHNGESFASRLVRFGYCRNGYSSWSAGEVIGWGNGTEGTAAAMFRVWMASSGHRAVILTPRWRDVGLGVSRGSFNGLSDVYMYTVDFGRRTK